MASFAYTARTKTNAIIKGTIAAASETAAVSALSEKELTPLLVREARDSKNFTIHLPLRGRKVKSRDLVIFTRQLSTMINAGVPLLRSLATLKEQTESKKLRQVLDELVSKVEGGSPLSDSLAVHPKIFSNVYVNMVRAGETGGILDQILDRLANQVEKDAEIKSKLKGAMIYPGVISVITFGAFIFLMTGIIPKLKDIFDQFGSQLPAHTRAMLTISAFLQKYGVVVGVVGVIAIAFLFRLTRTHHGQYIFHKLLLRAPIFGSIIMKVNIARFARTFSSLTGAGVAVLESLRVTSNSLGNSVVSRGISGTITAVKNGQPISKAIADAHIFPPIVTQMTAIGEETGEVDKVLAKVAEFYEKEVDRVIASITSIIEPLLIIFLGGLVGLIVASVFGPISSLTQVVK